MTWTVIAVVIAAVGALTGVAGLMRSIGRDKQDALTTALDESWHVLSGTIGELNARCDRAEVRAAQCERDNEALHLEIRKLKSENRDIREELRRMKNGNV